MYVDKKKAIKNTYRVSEKCLFTLYFIGGVLGGLIGMYKFRHKNKKFKFKYGMVVILLVQIYLYYLICL